VDGSSPASRINFIYEAHQVLEEVEALLAYEIAFNY
jgi:hypothetical protein